MHRSIHRRVRYACISRARVPPSLLVLLPLRLSSFCLVYPRPAIIAEMALPPKWYQFLVSVFASLGSLLYGYDLGVIAGAVASDNFKSTFNPTTAEVGAVVSVFTGGAFFGAAFAGPAGDTLGRKKTILLGALIFILGGALQAGARGLSYLYAGRGTALGTTPGEKH